MEQLLDVRALAERTRLSPAYIRGLVAAGQLKAIRFGRRLRFEQREIDRWILSRQTVDLLSEFRERARRGQEEMRGNTFRSAFGRVYERQKKNGKHYEIHCKDAATGKWKQTVSKYARTMDEAVAELKAMYVHNRNIASGVVPALRRMTFDELADEFIRSHVEPRMLKSKPTIDGYLIKLRAALGPTLITEISTAVVGGVISKLRKRAAKSRRKGEVTNSSINRMLATLRKMLNFAAKNHWLDKQRLPEIELLPENQARERVLTPDEQSRLLDACAPHLRPLIIMALSTSRRWGEIAPLTWGQVDFENGWIRFRLEKRKRETYIANPITTTLLTLLKSIPKKSAYVFPNPETGLPYTTIKTAFTAACRRAGITGLRFHDLRHTALTRASDAGANAFDIQRLAGHADVRTTARYVNSSEQRIRDVGILLEGVCGVGENLSAGVN